MITFIYVYYYYYNTLGTYYIPDELVIRISKLGYNIQSFIRTTLEKAIVEEEKKKEVKKDG